MPGLSPADVFDAIRAATAPEINRDANWKTCKDWAKAWGKSAQTALRTLSDGIVAGVVAKEFRLAAGHKRPIEHYRFVGKAGK